MDALAVRDGTQQPKEGVASYNTLVDMWDKQIDKALEGDNDSFKHIVERLDGKAPQDFNIGGGLQVDHKHWVIEVVNAANADKPQT